HRRRSGGGRPRRGWPRGHRRGRRAGAGPGERPGAAGHNMSAPLPDAGPQDALLQVLRRSCRRRWWSIPLIAALLVVAVLLGLESARPLTIGVTASIALLINAALTAGARNGRGVRPLLHAAAVLDLALVGALVAFSGWSGGLLLFLLAAAPYAEGLGGPTGRLLAHGCAICTLAGHFAYQRWFVAGHRLLSPLDLPAGTLL